MDLSLSVCRNSKFLTFGKAERYKPEHTRQKERGGIRSGKDAEEEVEEGREGEVRGNEEEKEDATSSDVQKASVSDISGEENRAG